MALILAHLATLQLSLCSKTLSGTFLLLCYITSSLLFRVLTSLVSHLCSWGMWCQSLDLECVLIRGHRSQCDRGWWVWRWGRYQQSGWQVTMVKSRCPATTVTLATATTETVAVVAVAKVTGRVWLSQPGPGAFVRQTSSWHWRVMGPPSSRCLRACLSLSCRCTGRWRSRLH